ncbi:unnamed protein product [Absidia cylindrospora]
MASNDPSKNGIPPSSHDAAIPEGEGHMPTVNEKTDASGAPGVNAANQQGGGEPVPPTDPSGANKEMPSTTQPTSNGNLPEMKSLTVEELYDKDKFDLSTMEPGDVFTLLQTTTDGLTEEEAASRIEKFGHNRLESKEQIPF